MKIRRIASNRVYVKNRLLGRYAVEVCADRVTDYYPLEGELPFTEWLATDIFIEERRCEDGSAELVFRLSEYR